MLPTQDSKPDLPLRGLMRCGSCNSKLTGGNCKGKSGKKYPYYFCCNKECTQKVYVQSKKAHEEFRSLMTDMTASEHELKIFNVMFNEVMSEKDKTIEAIKNTKEKKLKELDEERERIEDKLITLSQPALVSKFEKRWEEIGNEISILKVELDNTENDNAIREHFELTLSLFENPVGIWDLNNKELRQLLINLLFNDGLVYKKNQGLGTPDLSLFMQSNTILCSNNTTMGKLNNNHLVKINSNLTFRIKYERK